MKFTKYSERGRIDKYVNDRTVITFLSGRNTIFVKREKHGGKEEYIQKLLASGYKRKVKAIA